MSLVSNLAPQSAKVENAVTMTSDLPTLTTPAAAADLLAGKQAIDGSGNVLNGTLTVADTLGVAETVGSPGTIEVEVESGADGSCCILALTCATFLAANIVEGKRIFGVDGSAKKLTLETGTVTPTAASDTLTLPCSVNVRLAVVTSVFETATGAVGCVYIDKSALDFFAQLAAAPNTNTVVSVSGTVGRGANNASVYDGGLNLNSGSRNWIAGLQYTWTAYCWDD